jgi:hypothetical protein
MNLRECFAVALAQGAMAHPNTSPLEVPFLVDLAQKFTDECMARRKQDAAEEQPE